MATAHVMMLFRDNARYEFYDNADETYRAGLYTAPFPNTVEDSYMYGMVEAWGQSDHPVAYLSYHHGDPILVDIKIFDE